MDRHALQTQFPPSRIELWNGPQFRLPSLHSVLITSALGIQSPQSPRQSTATVPQTRKKYSNLSFQESDFFSRHFLKRSKIGISDRIEIFPARDLAKTGSRGRSCHA